ncbi:hypothetical protein [Arachidicoccus soli]|uniref:Uncharacterized protein n=1 Tax=Arachidicoccus soli TaxID=2341117 RepID=A0A386HRM9_9BACT|nr:hypothetical protein [Arachidicoccus soli]AYD48216.1 hypothetical protein D6B99_11770 [Arachidicoccus soli]
MGNENETALDRYAQYGAKIQEAILNDKQIQILYAEKAKIYEFAIPIVILKNGKAETNWIDETNHPQLSKINEMIEHRMEQIKEFYF